MSYNGFLIKIDGTKLPAKFIKANSYKITPAQRQDIDSYVNANGELKRNVLAHTRSKIEINTVPMNNSKMEELMQFIRNSYTDTLERKVSLEYYCPDTDSYSSGYFYVPDIPYNIDRIDDTNNTIWYNQTTLKFIEY